MKYFIKKFSAIVLAIPLKNLVSCLFWSVSFRLLDKSRVRGLKSRLVFILRNTITTEYFGDQLVNPDKIEKDLFMSNLFRSFYLYKHSRCYTLTHFEVGTLGRIRQAE